MKLVKTDGGRKAAGYAGRAGDCVVRAIAVATGLPYLEVYDEISRRIVALGACGRGRTARRIRGKGKTTPERGTPPRITREYLKALGWVWTPTMQIGSGCTVHLKDGELPPGRLVVRVSKHICAVIDGVLYDTHDCTRGATRCVYGYWRKP